jgi:hypothetical protein
MKSGSTPAISHAASRLRPSRTRPSASSTIGCNSQVAHPAYASPPRILSAPAWPNGVPAKSPSAGDMAVAIGLGGRSVRRRLEPAQPNSPSQTISIPNSTQLVVVTCDKSSMGDMLKLIRWAVIGPFRSRVSLEAKFSFSPNATRRLLRKLLRHQGFKDRIEGSAKGDHRQSQGGRRQSAWRC